MKWQHTKVKTLTDEQVSDILVMKKIIIFLLLLTVAKIIFYFIFILIYQIYFTLFNSSYAIGINN